MWHFITGSCIYNSYLSKLLLLQQNTTAELGGQVRKNHNQHKTAERDWQAADYHMNNSLKLSLWPTSPEKTNRQTCEEVSVWLSVSFQKKKKKTKALSTPSHTSFVEMRTCDQPPLTQDNHVIFRNWSFSHSLKEGVWFIRVFLRGDVLELHGRSLIC